MPFAEPNFPRYAVSDNSQFAVVDRDFQAGFIHARHFQNWICDICGVPGRHFRACHAIDR
jgi:hypothetical protein